MKGRIVMTNINLPEDLQNNLTVLGEEAKRFAEDLLAEFGITDVTVDCSDIPYRSFRG